MWARCNEKLHYSFAIVDEMQLKVLILAYCKFEVFFFSSLF